jgi:hypothetical protein
MRVQLQSAGDAPRLLGSNDGGAAPRKPIEDQAAALGAIKDGVGDQANRFDRRVHNERLHALARDDVLTGIFPDIGPVPPIGPKLDVVDCWAVTMPEGQSRSANVSRSKLSWYWLKVLINSLPRGEHATQTSTIYTTPQSAGPPIRRSVRPLTLARIVAKHPMPTSPFSRERGSAESAART